MPARFLCALVIWAATQGCAVLHHCQVGEIDARDPDKLLAFEIKVSEMGINLDEAAGVAKEFSQSKAGDKQVDQVRNIVGLFQMGPRTGNPVYNDKFARYLLESIREKCKSGRVTGLTSIREMRKYPVISGEIVKVRGYCLAEAVPDKPAKEAKKKGKA